MYFNKIKLIIILNIFIFILHDIQDNLTKIPNKIYLQKIIIILINYKSPLLTH